MKDTNYFLDQINQQFLENKKFHSGNSLYGNNVIPIIKLFESLSTFEERDAFLKAIENILSEKDEDKRKFAVLICLGFIYFRDEIE
jgi:hypothetical protein